MWSQTHKKLGHGGKHLLADTFIYKTEDTKLFTQWLFAYLCHVLFCCHHFSRTHNRSSEDATAANIYYIVMCHAFLSFWDKYYHFILHGNWTSEKLLTISKEIWNPPFNDFKMHNWTHYTVWVSMSSPWTV